MTWTRLAATLLLGAHLYGSERHGIVIYLYDYTGLDPADIANAMGDVTYVFERADVHVQWRDCRRSDCTGEPQAGQVIARLVSAASPAVACLRLGQALVTREGGTHAMVFLPAVREFAAQHAVPLTVVLGHAVAHEVAHLLLASRSHGRRGLMKARWEKEDVAEMLHRRLRLSGDEARLIREHLRSAIVLAGEARRR